jgi:hypothetical protein
MWRRSGLNLFAAAPRPTIVGGWRLALPSAASASLAGAAGTRLQLSAAVPAICAVGRSPVIGALSSVGGVRAMATKAAAGSVNFGDGLTVYSMLESIRLVKSLAIRPIDETVLVRTPSPCMPEGWGSGSSALATRLVMSKGLAFLGLTAPPHASVSCWCPLYVCLCLYVCAVGVEFGS